MSIRKTSALAFSSLLAGLTAFSLAMKSFDSLPLRFSLMAFTCISVVFAFVKVSSLRCPQCGAVLTIKPWPSYNQLPKFLLWTGAEASCASCNKNVH